MARKRDYKAEYARRLERGKELGLTKSQARGHPRKDEPLASSPEAKPAPAPEIEAAIKEMNQGASMTAAARDNRVSPKRLKRYILAHRIARYRGRRLVVSDKRPRRVPMIIDTNTKAVTVRGFDEASRVGKYHNAVGQFLREGEDAILLPFEGKGVTDVQGRFHAFETDPNGLYRHAAKDEPVFHEIYQIVSN